ncbi:MAG: type II secretion system protein [Planctomycetes bacterium]|nr:type II secretion system protein [Planctomycetota bacterium]
MSSTDLLRRRQFTLLELLIVVAIIAILASLGLGALRSAIEKAEVARAQTQIGIFKTAIAMYEADLRVSPRPQEGATPELIMRDHGPYLYAALMNRPTAGLGGGPNSPYVTGHEITVGLILDRAVLEASPMGSDGYTATRPLDDEELARSTLPEFQRLHGPATSEPLVFLDPWGNPWHCRIWKGTRNAVRDNLVRNPILRIGFESAPHVSGPAPISGPVSDRPHSLGGIDYWSNGPNGINEYGKGDDVVGW